MSDYDKELIDNLHALIMNCEVEMNGADKYFELLTSKFPITGTKVGWEKISSRCQKTAKYSTQADFINFIKKIEESCLDWKVEEEPIIYIGDSLTEHAYRLCFSDVVNFFKLIDQIPQHHYFLNQQADWCLCLDMTDYLDFSFAPDIL
jgi:hypothetical protein